MEDTIMEDAQELPLLPTMELFTEVTQEQECGGNDPSVLHYAKSCACFSSNVK
jgi:hypothetical protein